MTTVAPSKMAEKHKGIHLELNLPKPIQGTKFKKWCMEVMDLHDDDDKKTGW